jgi:hypothetical protein
MTWSKVRFRVAVRTAVVVIVGAIVAAIAPADTLRVERDGTGDYTVIQDAIDAAASGDTIRIGLGRFNEQQLVTCPGWSEMVRVLVRQDTLTIIGSGPGTIIGQTEPYEWSQGVHKGIVASDIWGTTCLRVADLTVENVRDAIYTSHESLGHDFVEVRNCSFRNNEYSLFLIGDGGIVSVSECEFTGIALTGAHLYAYGQSHVDMNNCDSWISLNTNWNPVHAAFEFCGQAQVDNCRFQGGRGGISVHGASADIKNCTFYGQSLFGLSPSAGANVHVRSSSFLWQYRGVVSTQPDNSIQIETTVFQEISQAAIWLCYAGSLTVNNCDLTGGSQGVVWGYENPPQPIKTFNMENNYWGTDDPQAIRDLIHDRSDTTSIQFIVDFEPFAPESTPVARESWGDLKTGFR